MQCHGMMVFSFSISANFFLTVSLWSAGRPSSLRSARRTPQVRTNTYEALTTPHLNRRCNMADNSLPSRFHDIRSLSADETDNPTNNPWIT